MALRWDFKKDLIARLFAKFEVSVIWEDRNDVDERNAE